MKGMCPSVTFTYLIIILTEIFKYVSSVQLSCSVVSDSLQPMDCSMPGFPVHHQLLELAQTHRIGDAIQPFHPLSSPSPAAFTLSLHDALPISPSNRLILCRSLLSCPQSFPASRSFPMSRLFTSGGQCIGASASALPMNIQDWFPLGLTGLISLLSKGLSRVFSNTTVQKHQFFSTQPSLWSNSHICTWLHSLARWTFVGKVMSLLFNTLSRFVIAFLSRGKCL